MRTDTSIARVHGTRAFVLTAALATLAALGAGCASQQKPHAKAIHFQAEGARAYARGDLDRAAGLFSLALEYDAKMAEAHNGLGLVALARGDKNTAEAKFRRALAINEEMAEAHLNLGFIYLDRGEIEDALTHFRQALAIDPGFGSARLAVGETLLRLNKIEEARWELAKLCEVEPQNAGAHAAYAIVLARQGRIAGAEAAAQKAMSLDKELPAAHRARGEILKRRGDMLGSAEEFRKVLQAEPMSVDDRVSLVTVLVAAPNMEEAERELDGLEKTAPQRAEVAFIRAFVSLSQEKHADSITAARRALKLRRVYPEARMVLAEALFRAGQADEGRRELKLFLEEAPSGMQQERRQAEAFLSR
jgi:tetratricopeptide (TPR) repeat protein